MSLETPDRVRRLQRKLYVKATQGPIFEADFEDSAYGYRPRRSAPDAVRAVHTALCEGYTDVVDADLSKYFDTIPHQELLHSVARRVTDRHVLHLVNVKRWLKVPVEEQDEQGRRRMTGGKGSTRGAPQGGVISPLLANIHMHRFLRAWRQRDKGREFRARLITDADDFVIMSRGQAAAALTWTQSVMDRIGLVRAALRPGNQERWPVVSADLNRRLRGWATYFSYGTRALAYRAIDHYVADAVCHFLRRRHRVPTRGTRRFSAEHVFGSLGVLCLTSLMGWSTA